MENKSDRRPAILLIYTGGTIGMKEDPVDGTLKPFDFKAVMSEVPELAKFGIRIDSYTFSPLIDSSDVETSLWLDLAILIRDRYDEFDGFVILHGTDTMAYSASVVSFMLKGLGKPVIFTGSQLPIGRPRTDGKENLISAVEIAAAKDENGAPMVPEVCICFNSQLFRACRATKISATGFDAFASPNFPPLAVAGINIKYNRDLIRPVPKIPFKVHTVLDPRVSVLKMHPGMTAQAASDILLGSGTRAVILETYGSGNAISKSWFLDIVREAVAMGKVILNITQCLAGNVDMDVYATGRALKDIGVLSGRDMTTEAALAKLFTMLGEHPDDNETVKARIGTDLRGEITLGTPYLRHINFQTTV